MKKSLLKTKKTALLVFFMAGLMFVSSFLSVFAFPKAYAGVASAAPVAPTGKNVDEMISVVDDPELDASRYIDPDKIFDISSGFIASDKVKVMILVDDRSLVEKYNESECNNYDDIASYLSSLSGKAYASALLSKQNALKQRLSKQFDIEYNFSYTALFNGFSATVNYGDIKHIKEIADVSDVYMSEKYAAPEVSSYELLDAGTGDAVENKVEIDPKTGIFDASTTGLDGEGTLIAVIDTGLDYTHQAFLTELAHPDAKKADKQYIAEKLQNGLLAGNVVKDLTGFGTIYTSGLTVDDVYINDKVPFGYDYADQDCDVFPTETHGTHVAGIIAGNDDVITGVAPEAQLAIMKVFPDSDDGSDTDEILAAVEDCVRLGVDSINMSLGRDSGFAKEDGAQVFTDKVYEHVEEAGITLVVAASNSYSSGFNSTYGTNLTSNPDSATVGSPSTYHAAISVASISGKKSPYLLANDSTAVYFNNSVDNNSEEIEFLDDLYRKQGWDENKAYEVNYVVVPGIGSNVDYTGVDVRGKVAFISRGTSTFEEKIKIAQGNGAIAAVIYNNVAGDIRMVIGKDDVIPACSINMDIGKVLLDAAAANMAAGRENGGKFLVDKNRYLAGPFMSQFSSWGPSPNLELKPEITAHGGDIYSAIIGGGYDHLSGTSMASPNLCGVATLLRTHIAKNINKYVPNASELTTQQKNVRIRALVHQLLMSTATPALTEVGNPYSPRKQGAGLANLTAAINTNAYLYVVNDEGVEEDKTKLSLGDDPDRKGEYELKFHIRNVSTSDLVYALDMKIMTETVSSDQMTVAEKAYMITDSDIKVETEESKGVTCSQQSGRYMINVKGNADGEIKIKITLSNEMKNYLNDNFENGMFIEGFVNLTPPGANSYMLNIPYLAFYGDWTDAPMLDIDWKTVYADRFDNSIPDEDKIKPDVKAITLVGKRTIDGTEGAYLMGDYLYALPETGNYTGPEWHDDYVSLSRYEEGLHDFYLIGGFLRNAKRVHVEIYHKETGELMADEMFYNGTKAGVSSVGGILIEDHFDVTRFVSENGKRFEEGNRYTFKFTCELDYGEGKGNRNSYAFDFVIDSAPPTVEDFELRVEYQANDTINRYRYYLDLFIYDNNYPEGYQLRYYDKNAGKYLSPVGNYMIPINAQKNSITKVTMDITDYWDKIKESDYNVYITTTDYAMNDITYYVKLVDIENGNYGIYNNVTGLALNKDYCAEGSENVLNKTLSIYENYDLLAALDVRTRWDDDREKFAKACEAAGLAHKDGATGEYTFESSVVFSNWLANNNDWANTKRAAWFEDFIFESRNKDANDPDPVAIVSDQGIVTPLKEGTAIITVRSRTSDDVVLEVEVNSGSDFYRNQINIIGVKMSASRMEVPVGATYEVTCEVLPWNHTMKDYRIVWSMNENRYASFTPDPNDQFKAYVTANMETGIATPQLVARVQELRGDTYVNTAYSGVCFISVPEEYVVNYGTLSQYNGAAKNLVIPDDLGIKTIGSGVFFQNNTIEEVYIPEGVEKIESAAFAYCRNLKKVSLPASLMTIGEWAFGGWLDFEEEGVGYLTSKLETVEVRRLEKEYEKDEKGNPTDKLLGTNVSHLTYIGRNAFAFNFRLQEIDLSSVVTIDRLAFINCRALNFDFTTQSYKTLDLSSAQYIGELAFSYCSLLFGGVKFKDPSTANDRYATDLYIGNQAFYGNEYLGAELTETMKIPAKRIGMGAFADCCVESNGNTFGLSKIELTGSDVIIGEEAFRGCKALRSVQFTGTIKEIGDRAFEECSALTSIALPNGLTYLGSDAFKNCTSLSTLRIQRLVNLPELNASAFDGCTRLRNIVADNSNTYTIKENKGVLYSKDGTKLVMALPTATITEKDFENVTEIGDYALYANTSIQSIDLSKIEKIGKFAFAGCKNLTDAILSSNLETIPAHLFDGCESLRNVEFDSTANVAEVGAYAFNGCIALTSIDLGSNVTEIKEGAFMGDVALGTVTATGVSAIGAYAFDGCEELETLDISKVKATEGNPRYGVIGYAAFRGCIKYNPNEINASVIADYAFNGASALSISKLPETTIIGNYAFSGTAITSIDLPVATSIGAYAFGIYYDYTDPEADLTIKSNLTSVTMSAVKEIFDGAFSGTKLTTVKIPASTEYIGKFVFADTTLTKIDVDESNEKFTSINGVLYRIVPNGYELISCPTCIDHDFATDEGSTKKIPIVDKTIRIEAGAFVDVKVLEEIDLPYELAYIGNFAFFGCDNLMTYNFRSFSAPILELEFEVIEDYRTKGYDELGVDPSTGLKERDPNTTSRVDCSLGHFYNFGFANEYDLENIENNRVFTYPQNAEGYSAYNYAMFFTLSKSTRTEEIVKDANTVSVVNSLRELPALDTLTADADREYSAMFRDAYNAYNNLIDIQKELVKDELIGSQTIVEFINALRNKLEECDLMYEKYIVRFVYVDENNKVVDVATQNIRRGSTAQALSTEPTRDSYKFAGYYTSATYSKEYSFSSLILQDTMIYIKWDKVEGESSGGNEEKSGGCACGTFGFGTGLGGIIGGGMMLLTLTGVMLILRRRRVVNK